jgi:aspartokinase/homoserine dehydrogenase 1
VTSAKTIAAPVTVHKFGGTSVADAECFIRVASIVAGRTGRPVVVVSAMAGVTDALIRGAQLSAGGDTTEPRRILRELEARHAVVAEELLDVPERTRFEDHLEERVEEIGRLYDSLSVLGELTPRSRDAVMGFGEQLSAALLAAVLRARGLRAEAVSATMLIVTDDRFGAASPQMEPTRKRIQQHVAPLVETGTIPVITGYIAATKDGIPTTLGRSGSDRTAAIVAAGLDADEVWIWTDVDGILTADPKIVAGARTLAELSYDEAANLARFGAEVLHPRTIRPVIASGIPLRIVNSFRPEHPGTRIVPQSTPGRGISPAIVSATGMRLLAVGNCDEALRLLTAARTLQRLSEGGIDVRMFSMALSDSSLGVVIREQDRDHVLSLLRRDACSGRIEAGDEGSGLMGEEEVAIVSVIGSSAGDERGIASHAFAALGKHAVRVIAVTQAVDGGSVSFCIPAFRTADTVCFLHSELGFDEATVVRREAPKSSIQGGSE